MSGYKTLECLSALWELDKQVARKFGHSLGLCQESQPISLKGCMVAIFMNPACLTLSLVRDFALFVGFPLKPQPDYGVIEEDERA